MASSHGNFVVKKIKYEKPILYGMDRGSQDAEGMGCSEGSTFSTGKCQAGGLADLACKNGTWDGSTCVSGNMPAIFYAVCGTGSGNTTGCGTGSSAAGGCWPTGNST